MLNSMLFQGGKRHEGNVRGGIFQQGMGTCDMTGNFLRENSQIFMHIESHFHHWEIICKEHLVREKACMIMTMEGAYMCE